MVKKRIAINVNVNPSLLGRHDWKPCLIEMSCDVTFQIKTTRKSTL